ncbi:ABC transporter permease [Leekyejoonella antrihumi]|uniref:ABC transporter permease n=1 Tax=Leekyejoonella antrihumi TaxID=1660198 RepID=A0A563E632_9MICO|nr:ABC transporter permease [Leekyejoonella antrihumi]TWP37977.1 ABC transporter permease [Leekyejoonella antrihumi]
MITQVWQWLTSASSWEGSAGIGHRLLQHLEYSAITVLIASALAIPLGLWIGHTGRGRWMVTAANSLRAVPSLGLLFAVALWLGPKLHGNSAYVVPSIVVLVVLAIPPLLAGAYAGVAGVDPAARDAAHGMGMTEGQVLLQVEVPCALPLMLSGVRSATLQVIATATIASAVSLGGLGRFLIDGLALGEYNVMAGGAIVVALLALGVDTVLAALQAAVVSPGLSGGTSRFRGRRTRTDRGQPTASENEPGVVGVVAKG